MCYQARDQTRTPASYGGATAITVASRRWNRAESDGTDYIFGLAGNAVLDALMAETADNLRFHHAASSEAKLRTYASFFYQAGSWDRPRKVVARLECSLQPDSGGEITSTGMRQEVDIRYVVTSLKGSAKHLYEDIYCQRGQMENLIKLHKAQLFSDRMSCHNAIANQVWIRFTAFHPVSIFHDIAQFASKMAGFLSHTVY